MYLLTNESNSPTNNASMKIKQMLKLICLSAPLLVASAMAAAGPLEQAKRMHDRLAGVPGTTAVIQQMADLIDAGDARGAAQIAMQSPSFYNITVKNWVTPWTNEEFDVFAPLNDYTATVIGMVRDDVDFRQVLSGDILYVADSSAGVPAYSTNNNNHYEALEGEGADLSSVLVATTQSSLTGIPAEATAGVMTTRGAAKSFFKDGTNRAMFRFTLMNHMCADLEAFKDTSLPPDRIRQDLSRSPGGGRIVYNAEGQIDPETQLRVQAKYWINSNNFPFGYVTPNDNWDNYWREGQNQTIGWSSELPGSGSGAKSMGQELANSQTFASCQVTKVFKNVCLRAPNSWVTTTTLKTCLPLLQTTARENRTCLIQLHIRFCNQYQSTLLTSNLQPF